MPQLTQNLEKKIFYFLGGIFLILMPLMSLKSGISGDEETFHYPHGKNVFNYYATFGKDTTCLQYDDSALEMYGPVFDVITVAVIKIFKTEEEYQVRHILNSLAGWAAILFAALIAVMLGGWRAGIITLLFMFLSPRFLGHSFNNPKDIPFTAAYIFTIYGIIRFLKYFPEKKFKYAWPVALGIGLTIGVRVGGILLAVYFLFFTGVHYLFTTNFKKWLAKENLQKLYRVLLFATVVSIAGFLIGVILWPYAHQSPLKRTIEAMQYMEQYATSLRQVFEGKIIWSDHVPWYYLPKYIFMTLPEIIILGLICFFSLISKLRKQDSSWYFILLFVSVFPIFYIIIKESNVYGGWRHVSFVFPGIAILAAIGTTKLISNFKNKYLQAGIAAVFTILMILPLRHIIINHPHEYIYYNSLSGGVKKAYGRYEMDYFYHTLRAGSEWLIKNKIRDQEMPLDKPIIVASNYSTPLKYYFRNYTDKVKVVYIRYYERGNSDWDYAVIANSYINPFQLKKRTWPPVNTIHTINVDKKPVCAILERKDKSDLEGYLLFSAGNPAGAIDYFEKALEYDPNYEMMYYNLAQAHMNLNNYDEALRAIRQCLKLYPDYNRGLNLMGMAYLRKNNYENALQVFRRNMAVNPKYVTSYYYAGVIYAENNDLQTALKYLNEAITVNRRYKPAYLLIAQIYRMQGNEMMAKQYQDIANSIR